MKRRLPRPVFAAAVALLAMPFLTPCGSISVPLQVASNVGHVVTGASSQPKFPYGRNAVANTPPLHVVRGAAISRRSLIGDAQTSSGRLQREGSMKSAGTRVLNATIGMAAVVDPMLAGFDGFAGGDTTSPLDLGRPEVRRGSLLIMDTPQVELLAYEVRSWQDKTASRNIAHAWAQGSAKLVVREDQGHEYWMLADRIHYHAASHELILEGNITIRSGAQTIHPTGSGLVRLDVARRTVHVAGDCRISMSPSHDSP